jgi:sulfate-transporting ATPase
LEQCRVAQYIYTMNRVSKIVPPRREILKDISLSFFPGAKIGVLGLNGSGKSTLLKIMAGVDKDFQGEARAQPGIKISNKNPHLIQVKMSAVTSKMAFVKHSMRLRV